MTDLDKRVATLRGWAWDSGNEWWIDTDGAVLLGSAAYLPSTNLWQAVALWDEARPEGWYLSIHLCFDGKWLVKVLSVRGTETTADQLALSDLPRAITQAWVEAMEGKP